MQLQCKFLLAIGHDATINSIEFSHLFCDRITEAKDIRQILAGNYIKNCYLRS